MVRQRRIRVLFVGEAWPTIELHIKGFDVVPLGGYQDYSVWLKKALGVYQDVEIIHMPNCMASDEFPNTLANLKKFDVLILSDVGSNTLVLYPERLRVPMGPNRLNLIKEFVNGGRGVVMIGGYMSFQGIRGMANYHGTPIEEILPVYISKQDDRVEVPEGMIPEIVDREHLVVKGITGAKWPMFLGYNKLKLKEGAALIARYRDDPFIAVTSYGGGRTMAFASDLAPHWGTAFVGWEYYPKFWYQAIRWLAKRE
jgi:uncharacterized membrane protein